LLMSLSGIDAPGMRVANPAIRRPEAGLVTGAPQPIAPQPCLTAQRALRTPGYGSVRNCRQGQFVGAGNTGKIELRRPSSG
jgi:hypothetical protein